MVTLVKYALDKMKNASTSFDNKPKAGSGIFDRINDIINNASRYSQYSNNVSDTLRARLQDDGGYSSNQQEGLRLARISSGNPSLTMADYLKPKPERNWSLRHPVRDLGYAGQSIKNWSNAKDERVRNWNQEKYGNDFGGSFYDTITSGGNERINALTGFNAEKHMPKLAASALDELTNPVNYLSLGGGVDAAKASTYAFKSAKLGKLARGAMSLIDPVTEAGTPLARRAAVEASINVGGRTAGETVDKYLPHSNNPYLETLRTAGVFGAALPGGIVGGHVTNSAFTGRDIRRAMKTGRTASGELVDSLRSEPYDISGTNNFESKFERLKEVQKLLNSDPRNKDLLDESHSLWNELLSNTQPKGSGTGRDDIVTATGKEEILNDINKRVSDGKIPAETGSIAVGFINSLPAKYLEDLSLSAHAASQTSNGTLGEYMIGRQVIRLAEDVIRITSRTDLSSTKAASNVVASHNVVTHEIAHHLMSFVPESELKVLEKHYQNEMLSLIDVKNRTGIVPSELHDYKFKNFAEFFAEAISNQAYRDYIVHNADTETGNILVRTYQRVITIAHTLVNELLRHNYSKQASFIYNNFLAGNYDADPITTQIRKLKYYDKTNGYTTRAEIGKPSIQGKKEKPKKKVTGSELKAFAKKNGGKIPLPEDVPPTGPGLEGAIGNMVEPRAIPEEVPQPDAFIRPEDVRGVGELPNRSPHVPPVVPNTLTEMPPRMQQPEPQGRSPYPATGLHIPPNPNLPPVTGNERPLRDVLEGLIWGRDAASTNLSADEAARQQSIAGSTGFERPFAPPIGDYRRRAEEMLNSLSDEELNTPVNEVTASELIRSLQGAQDIQNTIRNREVASTMQPTDVAGTRPLEAGGGQGAYGDTAITNRQKYRNPEALNEPEVAQVAQAVDGMDGGQKPPRGFTEISGEDAPYHPEFNPQGVRATENGGVGNLLSMEEVMKEQEALDPSDHKIMQLGKYLEAKTGINPSLLMNSAAGRIALAYTRQKQRSHAMISAALANLDKHAGVGGIRPAVSRGGVARGSVFNLDENGFITEFGTHWNDVFSKADAVRADGTPVYDLNPTQKKYIKTYQTMLAGINKLRLDNGLDTLPLKDAEGLLWIPRTVVGKGEIEVIKPTNHKLDRLWETATEGANNGIKYANPRENMELYLRQTYKDIYENQMQNAIEKMTVSTDMMVASSVRQRVLDTKAAREDIRVKLAEARTSLSKDKGNPDLQTIYKDLVTQYKEARGAHKQAIWGYKKDRAKFQDNPPISVPGHIFGDTQKDIPIELWRSRVTGQGGRVNSPRVMPREEHALLMKWLSPDINTTHGISKAVNTVGNISRLLAASTDFAAPFTHLLPLLFARPGQWAEAAYYHYAAFANPRVRAQYAAKNNDLIQEMIRLGANPFQGEGYEAITDANGGIPKVWNKTLGKVPVVGRLGGGAGKQTVGRFEAAYQTGLTVARVELWKALGDSYRKNNNLSGLAQYVRNITGGLDVKELGVGATQRDLESVWLAFSPKLFRSTVALFAQATDLKSQDGRQAFRALAAMAVFGGMTYVAIGQALGKDKEEILNGLNPLKGKRFLSYQVGDGWYGIGGQQRAVMQLFGGVEEALRRGDWEHLLSGDRFENPILSWYSNRGAPAITLGQTAVEGLSGGSVNSNPFEDINGPKDFMFTMGKSFIPFSVNTWLEGGDADTIEKLKVVGLGSQGLRTSFINNAEKTDQRVSMMGFTDEQGLTIDKFSKLNREQRTQFYEEYPVAKSDYKDNITRMFDDIEDINNRYREDINAKQQAVSTGGMTKLQFNEWYTERKKERIHELNQVQETYKNMPADRMGFKGSVVGYLESKNMNPSDKAVIDYYDLSDQFQRRDGTFDFDGLEAARKKFIAGLDSGIAAYVTRNRAQKEAPGGLPQEIEDSKKITKKYFEADKVVFNAFKQESPFVGSFSSPDAMDRFITKSAEKLGVTEPAFVGLLESSFKDFKQYNDALSEYKRILRLENPKMDKALTDFYGIEPANRIGYTLASKYGSNAGYSLNGAIAADKGLNNRKKATLAALDFQASGLETAPRKFYRPAELSTK